MREGNFMQEDYSMSTEGEFHYFVSVYLSVCLPLSPSFVSLSLSHCLSFSLSRLASFANGPGACILKLFTNVSRLVCSSKPAKQIIKTLAYNKTEFITAVKIFMIQALGPML